jgi:hypothetical protein
MGREHPQPMAANKRDSTHKVILPRIGLHSLVRAYTGFLALTKLEPKENSCKIHFDFTSARQTCDRWRSDSIKQLARVSAGLMVLPHFHDGISDW